MRLLPLALLIVLLVGCDANESAPTRSVDVVVPLEAISLHVGEAREVDAAEHFRHSDGAALTFEARRDSGRSVEVVPVDAGRFRLEAQSEGRSMIEVLAASGEGLRASATFAVDVAPGLCPPGPDPGQTDYFPLEDGRVWAFTYRHRSGPMNSGGGLQEGQLSMTVESVTCANRVRTIVVREVVTSGEGHVQRDVMRTFAEDTASMLRLELPGGHVHFDADPFVVASIPRYAAATSPDTLSYGSPGDWLLRVKQGRGAVAWNWVTCDPIWCESITLERLD